MTTDSPWYDLYAEKRLGSMRSFFHVDKPVIGMVHLIPLPGAPAYGGYGMQRVLDDACRDAERLLEGGVDSIIVENMFDIPYFVGTATPPETIAALAVAAARVRAMMPASMPMGVHLCHNGGEAELAVAVASSAQYMRACLWTGAAVWDTGEWDEGVAGRVLRKRQALLADQQVKIFADVDKKHSVRFPGIDLETHIEWTEFYLADALIISGRMTGNAPDVAKLREARTQAQRPLLIGSGATAENIATFFEHGADGVIVGSSIKEAGRIERPVDVDRVRAFVRAARGHT